MLVVLLTKRDSICPTIKKNLKIHKKLRMVTVIIRIMITWRLTTPRITNNLKIHKMVRMTTQVTVIIRMMMTWTLVTPIITNNLKIHKMMKMLTPPIITTTLLLSIFVHQNASLILTKENHKHTIDEDWMILSRIREIRVIQQSSMH